MLHFKNTMIILVLVQVAFAEIPMPSKSPRIHQSKHILFNQIYFATGPPAAGAVSELCAQKPSKLQPKGADLTQPIGDIRCDEVVAYMRALSRYYGRRCHRMGIECRDRDIYPSKWFDKVSTMITGMCQKVDAAKPAQILQTTVKSGDVKRVTKKCKSKNSL